MRTQVVIMKKFIGIFGVYGQADLFIAARSWSTAPGLGESAAMQPQKARLRISLWLAVLPGACAGTRNTGYFGTVTPQAGVCDPAHAASLTIRRDQVRFAPTQGVLVLSGSIATDGAIKAALTIQDANRKPTQYRLTARLADDEITGSYVTPRCTSTISLKHS